ncbi:ABC transporter permease [Clostridium rectalis]|uniref:ABC transporter permease n=1 Tax=Clostridium rectalis TaxID=2040295 RepID=UPI000F63E2B0|nr:ABC transporter permease [Clostridium rectalis]
MYRFQEILYKPFSTFIIVLSFVVGICSFQFCILLFNTNYNYYSKSKNLIKNTNTMSIKTNNKTVDEIIDFLDNCNMNLGYILDDSYEYQNNSQMVKILGLNKYYDLYKIISLDEGRMFSNDDINNNRNVAIIGNELNHITYMKKNKKYLQIHNKEFEVIGVFDKKNITSFCFSVFIPVKAIPDNLKTKPVNECKVYFNKKQNLHSLYKDLQLKDKNFKLTQYYDKELSFKNVLKNSYYQNKNEFKYIIIALLISFINLITFSFIWTTDIKKDLLIKIIFGATKQHIIKLITFQILIISFIGWAIASLISYFSIGFLDNYFNTKLLFNTINFVFSIGFTTLMILLSLSIVLINVFNSNLSEGIR